MDFIERMFGIAPDGGDGSTEMLWLTAVAAVAVIVGLRAWIKRSRSR